MSIDYIASLRASMHNLLFFHNLSSHIKERAPCSHHAHIEHAPFVHHLRTILFAIKSKPYGL